MYVIKQRWQADMSTSARGKLPGWLEKEEKWKEKE